MSYDDSSETIGVGQIFGLIGRHFISIALTLALFTSASFLAALYIPQKYKSRAVLNIQSSYFQHPLVSDLLSEVHDPGELSAQRLSLLRLALNEAFLDGLGQKYQIYDSSPDSSNLVLERERFLKQIEYFSISPTSFQVSIIADEPRAAYAISKDVLDQMTFTLIDQRYQTLMQARAAILKQARLLNVTLDSGVASQSMESLQEQLRVMEGHLSALRARFTDSHPDVLAAKGRTQALRAQINRLPPTTQKETDDYTSVFVSPSSRASTQEIYDDLLKKLSHLNIVLEMERDRQNVSYLAVIEQPTIPTKAFFPDRVQFALFGLLAGCLVAGVRITSSELQKLAEVSPQQVPQEFGLDFLGELPTLAEKKQLFSLDAPPGQVVALPFLSAES